MRQWCTGEFRELHYLPLVLPQNEVQFWQPGINYDEARIARFEAQSALEDLWTQFHDQDVHNKLNNNPFGPRFKRAVLKTKEAFEKLKKVFQIEEMQALRYWNIILRNHGLLFHVDRTFTPQLDAAPPSLLL